MSETKAGPRPSQVTMAGWVAVVGSALLVLTLFDAISRLRTVEMREEITAFLSTPPGSGLGVSVAEAVDLLRAAMMFTGAVAAAGSVLAVFVLQRHRAARICFTVAAGLMLVTAPVAGGVLPVLVAFSAVMLWTRPARDWFAGRAPAPEPARPDPSGPSHRHRASAAQWPPAYSSDQPDDDVPPPTYGFGTPAGSEPQPSAQAPVPQSVQPQPPAGQPPVPGYPGPVPQKRPATVVLAAIITWLVCGLTAAAYVVVLAVLLVSKETLITLIERDAQYRALNISSTELVAALWVVSAMLIVWCLASAVLAFLAFRRHNWARITLVVSAAISILLGLAAFPFNLLHLAGAGAVIALLFAGGANRWYSRADNGNGGYPGYLPPGGYPGYPPPGGYAGPPPGGYAPPPPPENRPDPPSNVW